MTEPRALRQRCRAAGVRLGHSSGPCLLHDPGVAAARQASAAAAVVSNQGTVRGWGYNSYGQLGDGIFNLGTTPVKFKLPRGVKVTAMRAGYYHTLALTATGRPLAAGRKRYRGQGGACGHHGDRRQRRMHAQPRTHLHRAGPGMARQLRGGAGERRPEMTASPAGWPRQT